MAYPSKTGTGGRKRRTFPQSGLGEDTVTTPRGDGTYDLTIKEGACTVTYFTSDEVAPAWQLAVFSRLPDGLNAEEIAGGRWDPDRVHLILGDWEYHSIAKDLVQLGLGRVDQADYIREFARVHDEDGESEDDIFELLMTYLELIEPDEIVPEVKAIL